MAKKTKKSIQKAEKTASHVKMMAFHFLKKNADRAYNHKQIAAGIDARGAISHAVFVELLNDLIKEGKLEEVGRGKYQIKEGAALHTGVLEVAKNGFGFVTLDDDPDSTDVFINSEDLGKALSGDRVAIRITKSSKHGRRAEGEVKEVLERARGSYIGTIRISDKIAFFISDDLRVHVDFYIPADHLNGAKDGQKVVVKMVNWDRRSPEGEVERVLGDAGENETEMHAILMQYGFVPEFPEEVENEVAKIPDGIPAEEIKSRKDFRKVTTFTIDPPDAKDFDDALSFRKLPNGHVEIGIHIADVSYYVKPGTRLDKEAYKRGTSVYLVDRTVPMLPEKLSNNLCSLVPHQDRLTFAAVFELDSEGKIHNEWFGRTIIHSDHRFAYLDAQAILDAGEGEYFEELNTMNQIAYKLREKRFKQGSINFEEDEVKFELDEKGKPIRVFRKVRKDTHKMIEDYMLLANRRVAHWVYTRSKDNPPPFVYRIHDKPNDEKLKTFRQFVATLGYELDLTDDATITRSLNELMNSVIGKPEQGMIQQIAVRAMAKAIYSIQNIGHYGLGFDFYTHFTSPIRRYPDLMVHRLVAQYLAGNLGANATELHEQCKHTSNMEKKATEAERASIKYKQVEYLQDKIGMEFPGIVTGVTGWGLYVELEESRSEGMVRLTDMDDDYYEVDEDNYCVRGRNTGTVIRLGDKIQIEVKDANLNARTIDFKMVEILEQPTRTHLDDRYLAKINRDDTHRGRGGKSGSSKSRGSKNAGFKAMSAGSKGGKGSKSGSAKSKGKKRR